VSGGDGKHLAGVERIVDFTDHSTADAILAGWEFLATVDLVGVNAASLGTAEAKGPRYWVEWPAIAGLHRLFEEDRLPNPATMPSQPACRAPPRPRGVGVRTCTRRQRSRLTTPENSAQKPHNRLEASPEISKE
jgi:hypothetical protein